MTTEPISIDQLNTERFSDEQDDWTNPRTD
jgi:hypothetical protein